MTPGAALVVGALLVLAVAWPVGAEWTALAPLSEPGAIGSPGGTHPVAVATILADLHLDTTTITAALLHDTVEDTEVTVEGIEEEVGLGPGGILGTHRFEIITRAAAARAGRRAGAEIRSGNRRCTSWGPPGGRP
jgi:hypothetical protein